MSLGEQRQRDMKIAGKFGEYGDVYEADGELYGLVGMDLRTYFTLGPTSLVSIETIPHFSSDRSAVRRMELLLEKSGSLEEYVQLLNAAGGNLKEATIEQRCQALLDVSYTIPPPPPEPIVETPPEPPVVETPPVELPPDWVSVSPPIAEEVAKPLEVEPEVEPKRDLPQLPDDWWLTYFPGELVPVIFKDDNEEIERLEAIWQSHDNIFHLKQTPLRVDGVSFYDLIEVRWEAGDITPIFDRIYEKGGYGTIRVDVKKLGTKARRTLLERLSLAISHFRYDHDVFVFSYWGSHYEDVVDELDYRDLNWEFADECKAEKSD